MGRFVILAFVAGIIAFTGVFAYAGWDPTTKTAEKETSNKAKLTINEFKEKDPGMKIFFDEAYGYAVFPSVGKGGIAIGGAYGEGKVFERGKIIGSVTLKQISIGLQLGGQAYSEIIFFKDKAALDTFTSDNLEFGAAASAIVATSGASADTDYSNGVAIFTLPKGGLMGEASVAGQKFRFTPGK